MKICSLHTHSHKYTHTGTLSKTAHCLGCARPHTSLLYAQKSIYISIYVLLLGYLLYLLLLLLSLLLLFFVLVGASNNKFSMHLMSSKQRASNHPTPPSPRSLLHHDETLEVQVELMHSKKNLLDTICRTTNIKIF